MARHFVALTAITVAGWLTLLEVLKWNRDVVMLGLPDEKVGGVPWPILTASILAAVVAVLWLAPLGRSRANLLSRIRAAGPAFLPIPLVVLGVWITDTPEQNGAELLGRLQERISEGRPFRLDEVLRPRHAYLFVIPASARPEKIESGIARSSWEEAHDIADPTERRQLWVVVSGREVVAWLRLPTALGACIRPGGFEYLHVLTATRRGRLTHTRSDRRVASGQCLPR